MERVTVYIDGLNFYYGLRRSKAIDHSWQKFYWIDFVKLFELFIGNHQVLQKVIYFTTPPNRIQKRNRQGLLLKANQVINGNRFEVVMGKFMEKNITCPVCNSTYSIPEEKHTDVNISIRMIRDCALNQTDTIILVSADNDLATPLKLIKADYPEKKLKLYFPPANFSNNMNNIMLSLKEQKAVMLEKNKPKFIKAIMPDTVTNGKTHLTIPPKWKVL